MKFSDGYEALREDFERRGIPMDYPGFCDHPKFLEVERGDPNYLNNYAAFVATQPYSASYLEVARRKIETACEILIEELVASQRLGACVDISGILSRILDREGVWNCGIKGSLTIEFPPESEEEKTYFWSVDHGDFVAGHAWLFAPPFSIVDVVVQQQPYIGRKREYLPRTNLVEEGDEVSAEVEDIISPSVRRELQAAGIPRDQSFSVVATQVEEIQRVFPALQVQGAPGATMKYCPVAVHASDTRLEDMRNMDFGGKTPYELYEQRIAGKLANHS